MEQLYMYKINCGFAMQVDTESLRKLSKVDAKAISTKKKLTEMDLMAVLNNDSTYLKVSCCSASIFCFCCQAYLTM